MKKITRMTFVMLVILVSACAVSMGKTVVAEDGKTEFRIVIPKYSDRSTMAIALDLAAILKESTGALCPVYFDDFTNPGGYEIVIGEYNTHHDFIGQLDTWLKNTDHLGMWVYQDSGDAPMPRPTFAAMQRNLRLFRDRNVNRVSISMANMVYKRTPESDGDETLPAYAAAEDYYSRQGEYGSWVFNYGFEHLRAYIGVKLLWDSDFDWREGVREFCDIYYGAADKEIAKYALKVENLDAYDK